MVVCEQCNRNEAIYCCPGCGLKFCTSQCQKAHKASTKCTGIQNPTNYVPRQSLLTLESLNRDYNFITKIQNSVAPVLHAPFNATNTVPAKPRIMGGVAIIKAPRQLTRAKENRSRFDKLQNKFLWTIELVDPPQRHLIHDILDTDSIDKVLSLTDKRQVFVLNADNTAQAVAPGTIIGDHIWGHFFKEYPTFYAGELPENYRLTELSISDDSDSENDSD
ncbi:hypothetical protein CANCADRAFT_2673 [Tortispora caseinolytica NRRL Y-17796]|uniref:HIT-type domain-containing protein n=1 Tax=Tortispora caseinolytica NRRL Y-17796 TaxID=767744 RepID=A0A1E4TGQ8_9ASCO|nr:hypothetical protein CANCADRAFT_2673 [Tortispora caseinolytica NRRL Y-17796]